MKHAAIGEPIESLLRRAGWYPGRRDQHAVAGWQAKLALDGFSMHAAAEAVLLEFGGLHVGDSGPGVECARADVRLDPTLAIGERDRLQEYFPQVHGRGLYPLGETDGGHCILAIAEDGEVFRVMDEVIDRWPSFRVALRALLLGLRSRAV